MVIRHQAITNISTTGSIRLVVQPWKIVRRMKRLRHRLRIGYEKNLLRC